MTRHDALVTAEPEQAWVPTVDGRRLSVLVSRGDGVPALLIHGFGSNARANWGVTGWWRDLDRAGIPWAAVDLRGHGLSDRPHRPAAYSLELMLADLRQVLDRFDGWFSGAERADLIGYSLGGRLSAELAATAPERLRRLVIGGQNGSGIMTGIDQEELAAAFAGGHASHAATRLARIAGAVPGNDTQALHALVTGMLAEGRVERPAPGTSLPTLLVVGEEDPVAAGAQAWADRMRDGRLVTIPGRNHVSVVTSAVYRAAAIGFLGAR